MAKCRLSLDTSWSLDSPQQVGGVLWHEGLVLLSLESCPPSAAALAAVMRFAGGQTVLSIPADRLASSKASPSGLPERSWFVVTFFFLESAKGKPSRWTLPWKDRW